MSFLRLARVWAGVILVIALCGCGGNSPIAPTPPDPPPPPPPPPVIVPPSLSVTKFLAFGDSLTSGTMEFNPMHYLLSAGLETSYPFILQALLRERYSGQPITVANAGFPADLTQDGLMRLPGVLTEAQPELVMLMEGVNDLNRFGAPGMQRAWDNIGGMIAVCRAQGKHVLVGNLLPQRPGASRAFSVALIDPFNSGLKDVVRHQDAMLVDLHAAFGGDLNLLGPDGLHPSAAGYQRIAQTFFDTIRQGFEKTSEPVAAGLPPSRKASAAFAKATASLDEAHSAKSGGSTLRSAKRARHRGT